jgi:hypothetical protein
MFTIKVEYLFIVALLAYAYLSYKFNKDEEEDYND